MTTQTTTRRQTITAETTARWARAALAARRPRQTTTELIEDVEWLIETGEYPPRAARRLGTTQQALERRLRRAGRHDLANYFTPYRATRGGAA